MPTILENQGSDLRVPATVSRIIWSNPATNFAILEVFLNRESKYYDPAQMAKEWKATGRLIVKSNSFDEVGEMGTKPVVFVGSISNSTKYGDQLQSSFYFVDEPETDKGMIAYLKTLPYIGIHRARALVKSFKSSSLGDIIENRPQEILDAKIGLNAGNVEEIRKRWVQDKVLRKTYLWLGQHGISIEIGRKVIDKYGDDAVTIIESDPYQLVTVRGIGFKIADAIAFKVSEKIDHTKRCFACICHVLDDHFNKNGNLCLPFTILKRDSLELLNDRSLDHDYQYEIRNVVDSADGFVKMQVSGVELIYLREVWEKENGIAKMLCNMARPGSSSCFINDDEMRQVQVEISQATGRDIVMDGRQIAAVRSAFNNSQKRVTVITGGGGTGKSTICRCICSIARKNGLRVCQMTPTGKAAKVLYEKTGTEASTIHRALGMKPGEPPNQMLDQDIIIIDEFSMCGIDTVYASLWAIAQGNNPNSHLVIVGDHQQLPSVSPGNFLADIIQSDVADVVRLDQIYRQGERSYITIVANNIAKGLTAHIPPDAEDIRRQNIRIQSRIPETVCEIIKNSHEERGIPFSDMHVMAAMKKGECGVACINQAVQECVAKMRGNPPSVVAGFVSLYEGDKVMQVVNDYDKEVFNGDMGVVVEAGIKAFSNDFPDVKEPFFTVEFEMPPKRITYRRKDFEQIMPAWCTTVHKFQGSQCPYIIFVAPNAHSYMLTRELVYTAITRAERKVIILGNEDDLARVPKHVSSSSRFTTLPYLIACLQGS